MRVWNKRPLGVYTCRVWSYLFKLKLEASMGHMPWMKKVWKMLVLTSSSSQSVGGH